MPGPFSNAKRSPLWAKQVEQMLRQHATDIDRLWQQEDTESEVRPGSQDPSEPPAEVTTTTTTPE